ncbi:4-hydroxy-3-methylbut-2-enyl diphosphate reductase [Alloactinosynnema sp. L-07]|uniref:4-hydroxy-3-methylbut-2-enyl diphosphate reductase n=1 Tax=Alloactinosynnema sp. L-07 TaxID=1653480 RepID=UPI00065EFEFD|nr:4-hydroxy-3-methylbut-2-enyl diphosphate reductase [Alloactinosynnema sp. L-07]CRK59485.1 4-hydroxy-3-methylbut-2-enyl diphosphate reductase [Alloactinosynnema sp. L-07]
MPDPTAPVTVADHLVGDDTLPCPAAPLIEGTLRRQGKSTRRGPLTTGQATAWVSLSRDTAIAVDSQTAHNALAHWIAVSGPRRILLAAPRAFCAGVERAIDIVDRALEDGPVHVRKQIVHNVHVVNELSARGAIFVDELDAVPDNATVVFSAHGVAPSVREDAGRRGLQVIDATCPLVAKVHAEAIRFAHRGDTILFIGHAGHEETEGTLGEVPDRTILVQSAAEAATVTVPDPSRVAYLTQTTLAVDETAEIIDVLRARFPDLKGPGSDDICYATTNRQDALLAIAADSDLVLVVGSANSSNSQRLVELANRQGTPAHLIDDAAGIRSEWLEDAHTIGITAGASAPPTLVDEVVAAIGGLGTITVTEYETARETIHFTLPGQIRRD